MRLVAALVSVFGVVHAVPSYGQSAFCNSGSAILTNGSDDSAMQAFNTICKPGDIISLPGDTVDHRNGQKPLVQLLCDFNKTIYVAPNGILSCVMVAVRQEH